MACDRIAEEDDTILSKYAFPTVQLLALEQETGIGPDQPPDDAGLPDEDLDLDEGVLDEGDLPDELAGRGVPEALAGLSSFSSSSSKVRSTVFSR